MDMVAERVWASRERHFEEEREIGGAQRTLMQCASIGISAVRRSTTKRTI